MTIKFNGSNKETIGIEVETQVLDGGSFALTPKAPLIISDVIKAHPELEIAVKPELMKSNLEINTKVCSNLKEAGADITDKFRLVMKCAEKNNLRLALGGTHPFSKWSEQEITDSERYSRILDRLKIVGDRFNIFGLHVHVGVSSGERCIQIINRLLFYLPHILSLSVNSPFWDGYNTGLRSYRSKVFETLPHAGLPFYFKDWADYTKLVENYIKTNTIETIREIWWDVRPHPDFGTIEVRICDSPRTLGNVFAIAGFIQALIHTFNRESEEGVEIVRPHSSIVRENKWRACRFGYSGSFIDESGEKNIKTRDALNILFDKVEASALELGTIDHINYLRKFIQTPDHAELQLREFKNGGNKRVAEYLSNSLTQELK